MSTELIYQSCIVVLGLSWIVVYLLVIRLGMRDRTYGMPMVALCGNIAWEYQFAFATPYEPYQQAADVIWFTLDLFIAWTVIRYGPAQFPGFPARGFYGLLAITLGLAFTAVTLLTRVLGDTATLYIGFGDTMLMSALFITMAIGRGSMAGQSLVIGYTKWLGTPFGCFAYYFLDPDHSRIALIGFGGIAIFVLDGCYVAVLHWLRATKGEHRDAGLSANRHRLRVQT